MAPPADPAPALIPPAPAVEPALAPTLVKATLVLAVLLAAGYAARFSGLAVLAHIQPTAAGAALFVLGATLASGAGLPRAVVAGAAGYAFGAWRGGALALLAQMLGCAANVTLARVAFPGLLSRRFGGRLARMDRFLAARPFTATLTLRLLPVGSNLALNLVAGLSGMRAAPFYAATLLGYLPQTLVFALAGSGVHVDRAYQLALGIALFLASSALGWLLLRHRHP